MQSVSLQQNFAADLCSVFWPVTARTMTFSHCAFMLDGLDRNIDAKDGKNGNGRSYKGRILTKSIENDKDKSVDTVFWGPDGCRPSLTFGVPYIGLDVRYKAGMKIIRT